MPIRKRRTDGKNTAPRLLVGKWAGSKGTVLQLNSIDNYIVDHLENPCFWLSLHESRRKGHLIDYAQMRLRACERFNQYLEALGYQLPEHQGVLTQLGKYNPVIRYPLQD